MDLYQCRMIRLFRFSKEVTQFSLIPEIIFSKLGLVFSNFSGNSVALYMNTVIERYVPRGGSDFHHVPVRL